jgi:hypothetical protein
MEKGAYPGLSQGRELALVELDMYM